MKTNEINHLHTSDKDIPLHLSARYILFLIDSKYKEHDGMIFSSYKEAREYASDCFKDNYCDKAVIGMFCLSTQEAEMMITMVETIGFKADKKNVNQLELFSQRHG